MYPKEIHRSEYAVSRVRRRLRLYIHNTLAVFDEVFQKIPDPYISRSSKYPLQMLLSVTGLESEQPDTSNSTSHHRASLVCARGASELSRRGGYRCRGITATRSAGSTGRKSTRWRRRHRDRGGGCSLHDETGGRRRWRDNRGQCRRRGACTASNRG